MLIIPALGKRHQKFRMAFNFKVRYMLPRIRKTLSQKKTKKKERKILGGCGEKKREKVGSWGGKALQLKCLLENTGEVMTSNVSKVNTDGGGMGRGRENKGSRLEV